MTLSRLIASIALIGVFTMAMRASTDSDTWWHLRAGTWMLEHRQVLDHDEFSSTRSGQPWINHSWLSQVVMAGIWQAAGFAGLNLMTAALVTLAFIFVYWQSEGGAYLRAFTLVLAAASSGVYWSARPQLFSFALAAAFGYVLWLFRWRGVNRLWILPLLMLLWVNLHAGFAIGFILLALTLAGQATSLVFLNAWASGRRSKDEGPRKSLERLAFALRLSPYQVLPGVVGWKGVAWLLGTAAACLAVVPLNPFGLQAYWIPFKTVSIGVLQDFIQEWMSPNFHMREAQLFIGLLLVTLAAVGYSRRRMDLTDFVLVASFAYMALLAARNIALFALIAPPVLTRHAASELTKLGQTHPRWRPVVAPGGLGPPRVRLNWGLLGLVSIAGILKSAIPIQDSVNQAALARTLPVAAAEFVAQTRPAGPMFNSYDWGGYLAWTLYPEYRVYVDGRTDLYDDRVLREYIDVALGRRVWREVFAREGIRLVVIEHDSLLAEQLRGEPEWVESYSDTLACVFEMR